MIGLAARYCAVTQVWATLRSSPGRRFHTFWDAIVKGLEILGDMRVGCGAKT